MSERNPEENSAQVAGMTTTAAARLAKQEKDDRLIWIGYVVSLSMCLLEPHFLVEDC